MIDLYSWGTPNGHKISIMLEECGLDYTVYPVDISKGLQRRPDFLAINPNGKIPAIVDHDGDGGEVRVFESVSILIYLAEKCGKFLPEKGQERSSVLSWLAWQAANVGPMFGQAFHFYRQAPKPQPYATERYRDESLRLLSVIDNQLSKGEWLAGETYSIADMACFSWIKVGRQILQEETKGAMADMPHCQRWLEQMSQRPAVQKGILVPEA
jgi:GST-like protein